MRGFKRNFHHWSVTNEKFNWEKVSVKEMFKGLGHLTHLISCKFDEMWHFTFYNRWPLDMLQCFNWTIWSAKMLMMNALNQSKERGCCINYHKYKHIRCERERALELGPGYVDVSSYQLGGGGRAWQTAGSGNQWQGRGWYWHLAETDKLSGDMSMSGHSCVPCQFVRDRN